MNARSAFLAPGFGDPETWGPVTGHIGDPRIEPDDCNPEADAELVPAFWLDALGTITGANLECEQDLGFVPAPGSDSAQRLREKILDSTDADWLIALLFTEPAWAEHAVRRLRDLCLATPDLKRWAGICADRHSTTV